MSDVRIVVDHQKLEYEGPFDMNALVMMMQRFMFERGFDRKLEKDFELDTKTGKQIEWQVANWKKISDYAKHIFKIRILVHDYVKVDAENERKKVKVGSGSIIFSSTGF